MHDIEIPITAEKYIDYGKCLNDYFHYDIRIIIFSW